MRLNVLRALILKSIVFSFVFTDESLALEVDPCSIENLTQQCRIFEDNKSPKITFPDGTFIWNLFALEKQKSESPEKQRLKLYDEELDKKIKVSQILEKIPDSRLSARFKMALVTEPRILQEAFLRDAVHSAHLPWPANQKDAEEREISADELKASIGKLFKPEELASLREVLKFQDVASNDQDSLSILDTSTQISITRLKIVQGLIEYVRSEIVDQILDGRKEETIASEEKALIKKIRSIQYINPTDPSASKSSECQGVLGNAFYQPINHSFTLCPNIVNYPDANLVQIIAHEFTHSIDPCSAQSGLYKINHDRLAKVNSLLTDPGKRAEFQIKHPGSQNLLSHIEALPPKIERTNNDLAEIKGDPTPAKWLVDQGILKLEASGHSMTHYPFQKQYQCLLGSDKEFYRMTPSEIEAISNAVIANRTATNSKDYDAPSDRRNLHEALKVRPECALREVAKGQRNVQDQEVLADWMSAKVLGAYLKIHPPKSELERVSSISFFAATACYEAKSTEKTQRELASGSPKLQILEAARGLSMRDEDSHPPTLQRMNANILKEPNIRKFLGCPKTSQSCFDSINSEVAKPAKTMRSAD